MAEVLIQGVLREEATGGPGAALHVEAWDDRHGTTRPLGAAVSDERGSFTIAIDEKVRDRLAQTGAQVHFVVRLAERVVADTRDRDEWEPREPKEMVIAVDLRDRDGDDGFEVRGRVVTDRGTPAPGLLVRAVDRRLRVEAALGEAVTGPRGDYAIAWSLGQLGGKRLADLEVRVFGQDRTGGGRRRAGKELARSSTAYQAPRRHVVDLHVAFDAVDRDSEHDRLLQSLAGLLGEVPLAEVDPDGVMYLANRAGWDPRIVAMAVQAERAEAASGIPAEHYYAVFRTAAAGGPDAAHRLTDERLGQAIEAAQRRGLIGTDHPLDATLERHRGEATTRLRSFVPSGAVSSVDDLLSVRLDEERTSVFVDRLRSAAGRPEALWDGLREAGFEPELVERLQTDGKLGFLTRHNAPLMRRLTADAGVERTADLVTAGLYEPGAWQDIVGSDVPAGLTAEAYAEGLAAQVRLAYPTLVTADLVRRGEVEVGPAAVSRGVAAFLAGAPETLRIGTTPVRSWAGFDELDDDVRAGVLRVERMYQLSPSDGSMRALAATGLDSALALSRYSEPEFLAAHGDSFPSTREATLVHRKAQEVHGLALNLATGYLTQRGLPPIHALGGRDLLGDVLGEDAPAKATLETLFGNLDFCACDHCRSVLSPAAYLVDLFELLDLGDIPHDGGNPVDVLFARRPDLQHLLLSCENTNVAVPYVDLVNEVLEHHVVNGDLAGYEGHDTAPGASSADLLADPAFVEEAAYTALATEVHPAPLPFDLPLETLRLLHESWGTTLADALAVLGTPAAVRRERLGLSGAELDILTDTGAHALPEHYGEPPAASLDDLDAAVANAKVLSGRLDVRYTELQRILTSRFVNPGVELVPAFAALGVGIGTVQSWFDGDVTDDELLDLLPDGLDTAPYGGDVAAWLTSNRERLMGLIVLTPTEDADPLTDDCDFEALELRHALPDPAADSLSELDYHRLHRFVRLWRALAAVLDADIETADALIVAFLPVAPDEVTLADVDAVCTTVVDRLGNHVDLLEERSVPRARRDDWLGLHDPGLDAATRSARLAGLLRLGTSDLANLVAITGIDPFAPDFGSDDPSLSRFVRVAAALAASPLKVDDVDFLTRDGDPAGTRIPTEAELRADLAALRAAMATVDATLGSGAGADLAAAEARMALVHEPAVVALFFGLLTGNLTHRVPLPTVEDGLPVPLSAVTAAIGFDPFADELVFTGTMTTAERDVLLAAAAALTLADVDVIDTQPALDAYSTALATAIGALHAAGTDAVSLLGADHPELVPVLEAALDAADPTGAAAAVTAGILPALRRQLESTALRGALAGLLGTTDAVVTALTSGPDVLHGHDDATVGALADLLALGTAVTLDGDGTHAVVVDPLVTEDHLWYVAAPPGTTVALRVGGSAAIPATAVGPGGEVAGVDAVALVAGEPVVVEVDLTDLPAGATAALRWRTPGLPKQDLLPARVIGSVAAATAGATLLRLRKAALLAGELELTARELEFFASECPDTSGVLDDLPVAGPSPAPPDLWAKLEPLVWFAGFKRATEPDADTWVDVLATAALGDPDGRERVATIGSWRPDDVDAALGVLAVAGDGLRALGTLRALHRILGMTVDSGRTVAELVAWTVPDPDAALVDDVRAAVQASVDAATFRDTIQSVNDALRNQRRDALVAHILAHDPPAPGIETADQLYEHFLVDVQMDACMQTSRIRLALSVVQLFVTRCLMNLEPEVSPGSIRKDRWEWMRRYRVWEANRKIFLWPENWLEPELRDGTSPFFRELASDLLKSDITTELAEDAYLAYLKNLDDVARLEIVGCHLQPGVPGETEDDVLHVFGRTHGKTRQYWYRRREYGYWTPWEKVGLDIEGDLVVPTVWRSQLYLFWVTAVEKPRGGNQDSSGAGFAEQKWQPRSRVDVELTLNWGELYRGKWTSPKSTNMGKPLVIDGLTAYHPKDLLVFTRTEQPAGSSERLVLSVIYFHTGEVKAFKVVLTSKNAPPIVFEDDPDAALRDQVALFYEELWWKRQSESTLDANSLDVPRTDLTVRISQPPNAASDDVDQTLLTKQSGLKGWNVRTVMHPVENQWEAPFFYADEHSTFVVQPDEHHRSFRFVDEYVPIAVEPFRPHLDDLYEEVIVPNPRDPVWNPAWVELKNPNITTVLGDTSGFELDGWNFNALGLMRQA